MPGMLEIATSQGTARAHLHRAPEPAAALMLGHGAGGGVAARDLAAVSEAARALGVTVALVEQPYLVAGRRSPAPAPRLDQAWIEVAGRLRSGELERLALIVGGRSSGARVACRTAEETGAVAVLCLAFPLVPPRRASDGRSHSRIDELDAVRVPTLVVQGAGDPFGVPPAGRQREVAVIAGNHSLNSDLRALRGAVTEWLARVLEGSARSSPISR
ncbi:MAG: alpha/beta hydrolase [Solirubrobacterales bacterium]|nr:alpha/beta hydrolase [Solirubrobacterales bacterium]